MEYQDEQLEKLKKTLQTDPKTPLTSQYDDMNFEDLFNAAIVDKTLKTMALEYDDEKNLVRVQLIKNNTLNAAHQALYFSMSKDSYLQFCKDKLKVDIERNYNSSSNVTFQGVPARIFAVMPPFTHAPLITISTAKKPPETIETLDKITEEKLKIALADNFLIVGKSGSGKTYLLNYLLSKYTPKDERIGIIQEFTELFAPNEFTDSIVTPPKTPGQTWNDLQIIVEQTNLMRYDRIIVGELKGSEAWPFVINCASGTKGIATIHGISPQDALKRLAMMCLMATNNIDSETVYNFIRNAIQYVIYIEDMQVRSIQKTGTVNHGVISLGEVELTTDPINEEA